LGIKILLILLLLLGAVIALTQWRADQREAAAEAAFPPTGQIVTVDGVRVHVQVMGRDAGTAPDLVLIHGASGNLRDFTYHLAGRLAADYRVIMLDRPGLGWTDRLPQAIGAWNARAETPREQAALLRAAAREVGVTRAMVLGHSYGGAVALAWALDYPEDTQALVLLSAVSEPWEGGLGLLYKVTGSAAGGALAIPLVTAFLPQSAVTASIDAIFTPQAAPEGYARHIGAGLTLRRSSMRANAQQVTSLLPHMTEMRRDYARLTMPIELIHGTEDGIVPAHIHAERFVTQVPSARLRLLPGVGHMPHHAEPQEAVDAVNRAAARAGLHPTP
jgi:pimeloyl-ACP methyl ester carboxylesterase